jgi:hypothetical protein
MWFALWLVLIGLSFLQRPDTLGIGIGDFTLPYSPQLAEPMWTMDYSMNRGTPWPFYDTTTRELGFSKDGQVPQSLDIRDIYQKFLNGRARAAESRAEAATHGHNLHYGEQDNEMFAIELMLANGQLRDVQFDPIGRTLNILHAIAVIAVLVSIGLYLWLRVHPVPAPPPLPVE